METIALYCSVIMSLLFLSTGADKFLHFNKHIKSTGEYDLIPTFLNKPVIVLLGILEVFISIGLLVGKGKEGAGILGIIILVIYTCAMAHQIRKGREILSVVVEG